MVGVVAGIDFTKFESGRYRTFGRAFKLDRQIVVGVVTALQEWLRMDHAIRWANYRGKVQEIIFPKYYAVPVSMDERLVPEPVNCVAINFNAGGGNVAQRICDALADANPAIATVVHERTLVVAVDAVLDGEEGIIVDGLKRALKAYFG